MFKCEVVQISMNYFQETKVFYKLSSQGTSRLPNHRLVGAERNNRFIIGQIDKSIKVGDLLRCDGLPYMTKPVRTINSKYSTDSCGRTIRTRYIYDLPSGYKPFQLDSGYWVLRKYENTSKRKKVTTK